MGQAEGLIGEKLGSFRIESVLGSGAMGVVYRGTHEKNGRAAAVKVVGSEFAQGGKMRDRFEREAEILQQFRHPNIVRFLAWGKFRGTSYIAMEYVQGETLDKLVQEHGHMPWRQVVDLGIQICEALHYAHEHGVVHRDLKPSNLMLSTDGKIKLTDFGIAKDLDATTLTATGRTLGTAAYMSPEQIRGTPAVSHKTDLYSLGVVMYQMLVGKPPFEGTTPVVLMHCHLNEPPPRPSAKLAEIPKQLDELVVNLMAKSPADRPWDASAVAAKLTELRDKAESGAPVKMVWPTSGADAAGSARADADGRAASAGERSRKKTAKSGSLLGFSRATQSRRLRSTTEVGSTWLNRSMLETGLLVLALLGIGGFIAYSVWPPSERYLYKQAEALMASTRRSDWVRARDEYLNTLDERFPNNPYKEQTRKWRDNILLDEAEGRGKNLASGLDIPLTRPVNNAERKFVIANELASGASKRWDDLTAIRQWREFAEQVNPDDPEERQWHLLALHRIEQLENAITDRRQYIEKQLQVAQAAFLAGRFDEAQSIKSKLIDQFSRYTDLADIFADTPAPPGAQPKPASPGESASSNRTESSNDPPPKEQSESVAPSHALPAGAPAAAPTDTPPGSQNGPGATSDPSISSEVAQHFAAEFRRK
jgi:serine/threonine-protein kinase